MRNNEPKILPLTQGGEANVLAQLSLVKILIVVVLVVAAWVLPKWIRGLFDGLEKHNPRLRFFLRQVEPPLRVAIWFAALLLSAEILAPSKSAFLAALGSAALAIGLGLQDLIKNLIGGFVVIVDRPFQTGDRVEFGEACGEVKQIGLRSTKVLADSGMLVTIPNADVLTKPIFNANVGVAECMVSAEVALPASADVDEALKLCRQVAVCCPYTYLGRHVEVDLHQDNKRQKMTLLVIQAYVYDHRFASAMKTDILRRAQREFLSHGILGHTEGTAHHHGE
ncbi:mechanosensitive ion channel family protein [Tunturiibacter gelidoferens]|uniref:Small-conductance mechanosensitive channel n=1 Tax=Tunturiibacter gelidiferens TaxID=3069689 RepID=A0A9X0U5H7_9BACT|nr:mechanosensitive ion channel domain-containing protein [Edaphobacter lichenicola]MBB5328777.1 small-conductance mechanosensitive channel [Edaphobacter lichenicola]